ncbi:hypothetical protein ABPG75_001779 [Micractinium tetrahymenae]
MTGTLPPLEEWRSLHTGDSTCGSSDGEPAHVDLRAATPASSPFGAAAQSGGWTKPPTADVRPSRPSMDWGGAGTAFHRATAVAPDGFPLTRASFDLGPRLGKPEASRQVSGVAINDLMPLATDPKVRSRLEKATAMSNGRMSRKDILKVVESELSAKTKLKWGLIAGGVLLALCLLMLAANAGLTYAVVKMSQETQVISSGTLMDKSGEKVVATASTAGVVDLLYAHHSTAESATALLALKELVVTTEAGTVTAYQVFSSSLIPGVQAEFVVAAPADGSWAANPAAAAPSASGVELIRIVVCDWGVYEIRGGTPGTTSTGSARRLLAAGAGATPTGQPAGVQGMVYDVTTTCGSSGTCPSTTAAAATISCPQVPTCGADQKLYSSPCEAKAAGTTVICANCLRNNKCPASFEEWRATAGFPPNLAVDGPNFVAKPPPSSPPASPSPPPPSPSPPPPKPSPPSPSPPPPKPSPPSPPPPRADAAAAAAGVNKKPPPPKRSSPPPPKRRSPPPPKLSRRGL